MIIYFADSCHVETVVLLRGEKVDGHVEIDLDVDKPGRKSGTATYAEIKAYDEINSLIPILTCRDLEKVKKELKERL